MKPLTFGRGMKNPEAAIANMRENCKRDVPWFVAANKDHNGTLVIVGGGPSMLSLIPAIRRRQKQGAEVVALNGAARLLTQHGIRPQVISFLDPSPAVAGFVDEDTEYESVYVLGSIVHPSVFDKLEGRKVILWHAALDDPEQGKILDQYPDKPGVLIGGGNTVALRWLYLGWLLGFRNFHFYGIDSSYSDDGRDHAYTKHDGVEPESLLIMNRGKQYRCSPWMARQAHEFAINYQAFSDVGCHIQVHGEGLIPDMFRALRDERKAA